MFSTFFDGDRKGTQRGIIKLSGSRRRRIFSLIFNPDFFILTFILEESNTLRTTLTEAL
ncbi:unnamed protein product [Meloidogyne enterolobii]|uniref:Uncharacterized protein n=1 Tax=Meloidogyne enterolobii TaxID=390850 RepID=A0ACB0XTW1_MELEN